ncbi:hypothetical protein HPB48_009997 [Haemaphysalis longicornis]|uniref:RH2 domain-containing protein n=1 Tax=Haemaphysalis longicornis TaxID=44386 RepID=A0A9J6FWJ0_HAELO|nr:hypothetical protein HPB48_009997 [Haemaphysalis longicornis]
MRQLCDERRDPTGSAAGPAGSATVLQERLGTTVWDHDDLLLHAQYASCAEMKGKLVIDLDDPNRPRVRLDELKHILLESNELKARVSDLEEELALYRPKWPHEATSLLTRPAESATAVKDENLPVQGPINQQHEEKLCSLGRSSGIRKLFQYVIHNLQAPVSVFPAPCGPSSSLDDAVKWPGGEHSEGTARPRPATGVVR